MIRTITENSALFEAHAALRRKQRARDALGNLRRSLLAEERQWRRHYRALNREIRWLKFRTWLRHSSIRNPRFCNPRRFINSQPVNRRETT